VQPAGYRTQGNHILWHFTNEEPEQDIEIESIDPSFWKALHPLKDAAERTGTEANWYRYAMALLPDSIVGPYPAANGDISVRQGFVRGLQTSTYDDYVQRTLIAALNHCTYGSARARILRAAFEARYQYYRGTGDFLNGITIWDTNASTRAHDIYQELLATGTSTAKLSPEETRLVTWLTINMAGESMTGGYTLNALHELEQSRTFARQAGILDSAAYQGTLKSVLNTISPYNTPRLLVGVSVVPHIEIQQQKITDTHGNTAWRARIVLHLTLPPSEVPFVWNERVSSQPNWTKVSETGSTAESENGPGTIEYGFSNVDTNDYLIIVNVLEFSSSEQFQTSLKKSVDAYSSALLDNRTGHAGLDDYYYPTDAREASSIQSASYTWLQAVYPVIGFDADHGVTVALLSTPMADALCDKADTELKAVGDFFKTLSWTKDYEIDKTLQHNLDLVRATRGKNPTVTTVTYAADGTASRTSTSTGSRTALWIVLAGIGGLLAGAAMGILIMSRRKRRLEHKPQDPSTDSR
jgi:hypothetical protein